MEEKSLSKNEFVNGKIISMAKETIEHGLISSFIHGLLFSALFNKNNTTLYSSDQKYIEFPEEE